MRRACPADRLIPSTKYLPILRCGIWGCRKPCSTQRLARMDVIDNAVIMGGAPEVTYRATPERGQHTGEVLAEFGYSIGEIDDLMERGVI